jgi:hypothetical protein
VLGFRIDPKEKLQSVHKELLSLQKVYGRAPLFGVQFKVGEQVSVTGSNKALTLFPKWSNTCNISFKVSCTKSLFEYSHMIVPFKTDNDLLVHGLKDGCGICSRDLHHAKTTR